MATEPYTAYPQVSPGPAGGREMDIHADASMFGGTVGKAEEGFGRNLATVGDNLGDIAQQQQHRQNSTATDDAFNQLQQKALTRLYGDGTDKNPGFYSLKGRNAMDAAKPTLDGMEEDRQAIKSNLQNDAQRLLFETQSRRFNTIQQEVVGRHAAQQSAVWDIATQQAGEKIKQNAIGTDPFSDDNFFHNLADGEAAASKKAASASGSPEVIEAERLRFHNEAYMTRALAMAATNPTAALEFVHNNIREFNAQHVVSLQSQIENKASTYNASTAADQAYRGVPITGGGAQPQGRGGSSVSLSEIHPSLTTIRAPGGAGLTVSTDAAPKFQGLVNDFEAAGYKLDPNTSGGYNPRNIAGTNTPSEHAYGRAIDINTARNPKGGQSDIPPELARRLAAKWGLTWGGDWQGADRDPMHFEVAQGGGTDHPSGGATGWKANNPLNVTAGEGGVVTPGGARLATYGSMPEGVAATAAKLKMYQDERGLDTVRKMYTEWHKGDAVNDADMAGIAKALGVGLDQPFTLDAGKAAAWIRQAQPGETGTAGKRLSEADLAAGIAQFDRGGGTPRLTTVGGQTGATPDGTPVVKAGGVQAPASDIPDRNRAYQSIQDSNLSDRDKEKAIAHLNIRYANDDRTRKDAADKADNTITSQLIKDPTKVTPEMIADDPWITPTRKEGLEKYRQEKLKEYSGAADHDVKTYGSGWHDLYNRIHAPQNDPNRITDDTQLYGHLGDQGDLSVAGLEFLRRELAGTHTVQGAAEGQMKKDWLNGAHAIISSHVEGFGGGRDPIGETRFGQFSVLFQQQYEAGRRAGKTPDQLLNEKSPDYLGKLMAPFVRTNTQKLRDMQDANNPDLEGAAGTKKPATGPLNLTTAEGIAAAYKSGHYGYGPAAYDAALSELRAKGFARPAPAQQGPPPAPAPVVPTDG